MANSKHDVQPWPVTFLSQHGDIPLFILALMLALVPQRLEVIEQWVGSQKGKVNEVGDQRAVQQHKSTY